MNSYYASSPRHQDELAAYASRSQFASAYRFLSQHTADSHPAVVALCLRAIEHTEQALSHLRDMKGTA